MGGANERNQGQKGKADDPGRKLTQVARHTSRDTKNNSTTEHTTEPRHPVHMTQPNAQRYPPFRFQFQPTHIKTPLVLVLHSLWGVPTWPNQLPNDRSSSLLFPVWVLATELLGSLSVSRSHHFRPAPLLSLNTDVELLIRTTNLISRALIHQRHLEHPQAHLYYFHHCNLFY